MAFGHHPLLTREPAPLPTALSPPLLTPLFPPACEAQCRPLYLQQQICGVNTVVEGTHIPCICAWPGELPMTFEHSIQACESCFRREAPVEDSNLGTMWDLMGVCAAHRAVEAIELEPVTTVPLPKPTIDVVHGIGYEDGDVWFAEPEKPATPTGITSVLGEMYATRFPTPPTTVTITLSGNATGTAATHPSVVTLALRPTTLTTLTTSISRPTPSPSPATTIIEHPPPKVTVEEFFVPPNSDHNDPPLAKRVPPPEGFTGLPLEMRCIDCVKWDCSRAVWMLRGCRLEDSDLGGDSAEARPDLAPTMGVVEGKGDGSEPAETWSERMRALGVDVDGTAHDDVEGGQ